jgi:hypothetical protein
MLSPEDLRNILEYNHETGELTWKESRGRVKKGQKAGAVFTSQKGRSKYIIIGINGQSRMAHRVALAIYHGKHPSMYIDHIDGNSLNNRMSNLRDVDTVESGRNRPIQSNNTSGVVGVLWNKRQNKWIAEIHSDNKKIFLGAFKDKNKAILVRKEAEEKYGFHKNNGRDSVIR